MKVGQRLAHTNYSGAKVNTKKCSKCCEIKKFNMFHNDRSKIDGKRPDEDNLSKNDKWSGE